jgi:hypothetical protein
MPEVRYSEHNGERILLIDFSIGSSKSSVVEAAEEAMRLVRSTGRPHSIRAMLDFSGASLNKVVRDSMKRMSKSNGPYMKSVAFVGLGAVLSPFFKGLLFVTKRSNHKVFKTRPEALDWLAKN